jgi:hypothetical protein
MRIMGKYSRVEDRKVLEHTWSWFTQNMPDAEDSDFIAGSTKNNLYSLTGRMPASADSFEDHESRRRKPPRKTPL